MTRLELLTLAVGRARSNGFEFRKWYTGRLGLPWISAEAALTLLEQQRRYYCLLFSHEFACAFWKAGEEIIFAVPAQTFERLMADGTVATVNRKAFARRSARRDAWRYHLREMALAEDPLRYLRKYLQVQEDLAPESESLISDMHMTRASTVRTSRPSKKIVGRGLPRALPTELPAFLRRPYP